MKNRVLSILFALIVAIQIPVFAEQGTVKKDDGIYDVPVRLKHFYEDIDSMGNSAMRKVARIELKNNIATYTIYTSKMIFTNLEGGLTDLFVFDSNNHSEIKKISKKMTAKHTHKALMSNVGISEMNTIGKGKNEKKVPFSTAITFTKKAPLQKEIYLAVWVDAMDAIQGGGKGSGEQKATLQLDWNKAKKVEEKKEAAEEEKTDNNQIKELDVKDVNKNHWAYPAVNFVMNKGYFKGGSNGKFMPNDSITRGQFLTVLGRIANVNVENYKGTSYPDVKEYQYYAPYVKWSKEKDLCHIEGSKFMPDSVLNREEMAYIMDKFISLTGKELQSIEFSNFKDNSKISTWAQNSVISIAKKGVIKGSNGNFNPQESFTRAQVAQVLYNIKY